MGQQREQVARDPDRLEPGVDDAADELGGLPALRKSCLFAMCSSRLGRTVGFRSMYCVDAVIGLPGGSDEAFSDRCRGRRSASPRSSERPAERAHGDGPGWAHTRSAARGRSPSRQRQARARGPRCRARGPAVRPSRHVWVACPVSASGPPSRRSSFDGTISGPVIDGTVRQGSFAARSAPAEERPEPRGARPLPQRRRATRSRRRSVRPRPPRRPRVRPGAGDLPGGRAVSRSARASRPALRARALRASTPDRP